MGYTKFLRVKNPSLGQQRAPSPRQAEAVDKYEVVLSANHPKVKAPSARQVEVVDKL